MEMTTKVRSYKTQAIISRLQEDILEEEEEFLAKFKYRSLLVIKKLHEEIGEERVVDSLKGSGKQFRNGKKKLLLLSKIYSKNKAAEYHKMIGDCIKGSSEYFQRIQ